MQFKPHEYQSYCIDYLLTHENVGLFLDCGLGKTVISLTAAQELIDRLEVDRCLVIAPLRVAEDTWSRESEKWDHLRGLKISKVLGSEPERRAALRRDADIYVINRENVSWLCDQYPKRWPFDLIIIDELSSFKNPSSKRFKALRKVRPQADRVWGLTGTPAPNGLIDLWSQIYLLDRGERLGKFVGRYRDEFFIPAYGNGYITYKYNLRRGAEEQIHNRLKDLCISMTAEDNLRMPKRVDSEYMVRMSESEMEVYADMEREALVELDGTVIDAGTAAAVGMKLLQMCNGAVYDENREVKHLHDRKLDALEDIIESANGNQILLFYSYIHDVDRITSRLDGLDVKYEKLKDSDSISRWNNRQIQILLAHPASAGYGLNLQDGGCRTVVWFGLTWNLEWYQQANARIYRQGVQGSTVSIIHIMTEGTMERRVLSVLRGKASTQADFVDALKARIRERNG